MKKLNSICFVAFALIILTFAGCATAPEVTSTTTTTTTTQSPMNRNNNNGLASYMH